MVQLKVPEVSPEDSQLIEKHQDENQWFHFKIDFDILRTLDLQVQDQKVNHD